MILKINGLRGVQGTQTIRTKCVVSVYIFERGLMVVIINTTYNLSWHPIIIPIAKIFTLNTSHFV